MGLPKVASLAVVNRPFAASRYGTPKESMPLRIGFFAGCHIFETIRCAVKPVPTCGAA